jgi:hypothetical protein
MGLFSAASLQAGEEDAETGTNSLDLNLIRRTIFLASIAMAFMILRNAGMNPTTAEVDALARQINEDDQLTREAAALAGRLRRHIADSDPRGPGEMSIQREAARAFATHTYGSIANRLAATIPLSPIGERFRGLVMKKTWISQGDTRVRPLHRRLHARTKRFSEDFWRWPVNGKRLRFPGDPEAPLDATIGCRCIMWISWSKPGELSEVIRRIRP